MTRYLMIMLHIEILGCIGKVHKMRVIGVGYQSKSLCCNGILLLMS